MIELEEGHFLNTVLLLLQSYNKNDAPRPPSVDSFSLSKRLTPHTSGDINFNQRQPGKNNDGSPG